MKLVRTQDLRQSIVNLHTNTLNLNKYTSKNCDAFLLQLTWHRQKINNWTKDLTFDTKF